METTCDILLQIAPTISDVEDLQSTYIVNCVFNSFLSYTATMLNIVTIYAIRKTPSLPKPLKTLLLSLAVSDLGVGLLSEPFYIWLMVRWSRLIFSSCTVFNVLFFPVRLFATVSYLTVVAISMERFLAIHLHLRYQELVTHKRVVAVVISIWVSSVFVSFLMFWVPLDSFSLIILIVGGVGLILTTVTHIRIYLAVRRHKNQIQVLQVQQVAQADEVANFSSFAKSAVGIFYVYLVFLVCYLPYFIVLVSIETKGPSTIFKKLHHFTTTLVFMNSSLNPVIYCWKMRHIRHSVMNILRNMSWFRSCSSIEIIRSTCHTMP